MWCLAALALARLPSFSILSSRAASARARASFKVEAESEFLGLSRRVASTLASRIQRILDVIGQCGKEEERQNRHKKSRLLMKCQWHRNLSKFRPIVRVSSSHQLWQFIGVIAVIAGTIFFRHSI